MARRTRRRIAVTHKIVISRMNYRDLMPIFRSTYRFGVRNFILQPVKASGLDAELTARLTINEDEFMPHVNDLLRETEGSGAEIKLYGMSQIGVYESEDLVQETNLIKHVFSKTHQAHPRAAQRRPPRLPHAPRPAPPRRTRSPSTPPHASESATFDCAEDQLILNAALAGGVSLPFGCRMGSCGMCVGRLVVAARWSAPTSSSSPRSRSPPGFVLLCKSRPRSPLVIVTHQESELGL